ncbi:hypothetical protein V8B55DRAFT_1472974 [Mucor lusitanicus]
MHIWLHTHKHMDTQRVPGQVTFTFALATRHVVVCLHVDHRLCTGNTQLNPFTVKIHSMRIHHAHHFMCCSNHIQGFTLFQSRDAL